MSTQKQPSIKKGVTRQCEKVVKMKGAAKKWLLWYTFDSKTFNSNNSGEFCTDSWYSWDEATQVNLNCCY